MKQEEMILHEEYNFKNQPEKLKYLGRNFSGNGYWHQFEKISNPGVVWSELLTGDLWMIELTKDK
jgi:hypothetical protein